MPPRHTIIVLVLLICRIASAVDQRGPLRKLVEINRGDIELGELWALGADDFGADDDRLHVRLSDPALDELTTRGIEYQVIYDDIYTAYRTYRSNLKTLQSQPFADYHDLDSAILEMEDIAREHPDIASLAVIGYSIEGRPIHALRISDDASVIDPEEPGILILGCHHGREWISVEVPLFFARHLVENYLRDGDITRLINYAEVWIVPVVNPDGLAYTSTDRFWRKNRRDNGDGTTGVDLNRNYSVGYGGVQGSSSLPSSDAYRGTEPFSEPETQAVQNLMGGAFRRSFDVSLSYHSYGQVVLYPYNFTLEPVADVAYYQEIAAGMAGVINEAHSSDAYDYRYGQSSERLYLAAGTFTDWAHEVHDATAIVIELRPAGAPFFELPPDEITPTCRENLPAFLFLAEESLIPAARSADADADGFLDEDDYCPHSPAGIPVDAIGCATTQQDLDGDGVDNFGDLCPDTPDGQQVAADGCRMATAFTLRVTSNVAAADIDVTPPDIDGAGAGNTGDGGFTRAFAEDTAITLTASDDVDDRRFAWWIIDRQPQNLRSLSVTIDTSQDVEAEAVYSNPNASVSPPTTCGVFGLPTLVGMFAMLTRPFVHLRRPTNRVSS